MKEQGHPGLWGFGRSGAQGKGPWGTRVHAELTGEGERRKCCCRSTGLEVGTVRLEGVPHPRRKAVLQDSPFSFGHRQKPRELEQPPIQCSPIIHIR